MEVYNRNRDKNNSMRDEIREQKAKLKGAPLKEKAAYFKEYYLKTTVILIICAAFAAHLICSMAAAPSDTSFAAYFYNDTGDPSNTELIDGFAAYAGIDTKKHNAYIDTSLNYDTGGTNPGYDAYIDFERTMTALAAREMDIIVGNSGTVEYFSENGYLHDVTAILPEDLIETFRDRFYYARPEESGGPVPVGIYVSDSPKLNQYRYYAGREAVLGFIANSDNLDNAIAFLRYIYMERE